MQRVADAPDHLEAHEAGQREDDEVAHEAGRGIDADQQHDDGADRQQGHLALGLRLERRDLRCLALLGSQLLGLLLRFLRRDGLDLRRRRREGHGLLVRDGRAADNVIFHVVVDDAVFLGRKVRHHVTDVGGVERRALGRHPRREIGVTDDGNPIVRNDFLVRLGQLAVAATLGGKVDDDRTGFHQLDHVLGPQHRRGPVRDQGGGDDDVDVRRQFAELLQLRFTELGARGRRIAARRRAVGLGFGEVQVDELGAHGFDLLCHFGPHVERIGDRTQRGRGSDGGQTGHAGADDQHLGRGHLARRRHLSGEEAAKVVARLDHRAVTGDVGHGRQRVHFLRARNPRHHVHRDDGGAGICRFFHQLFVRAGVEERDQRLVGAQHVDLGIARRTHLGDDVGSREQRLCIGHDLDPGSGIGFVQKARPQAGACLDNAFMTKFFQRRGAVRRHGHTVLTVENFLGCSYFHRIDPLMS